MENILKSILETEQEAENIVVQAKAAAQKISQDSGVLVEHLKQESERATREKVDAYLAKVRQEASAAKEKILSGADEQARGLEQQAKANMGKAVTAALDRLLATM